MSVKIRLARGGSKKRPYYRIVVADIRMPRDGRYIERVGSYNPLLPKDHEDRVSLDKERIIESIKVVSETRLGNIVNDYNVDNVSDKVLKIILSYTDYVNRTIWYK